MDEKKQNFLDELKKSQEDTVPFNKLIEMTISYMSDDCVRVKIPMREKLMGNYSRRMLMGGMSSVLLDAAASIMAIIGLMNKADAEDAWVYQKDPMERIATVDLRTDFLRPGMGEWFEAEAVLIRCGRRLCVTRIDMYNDQKKIISVGAATHIFLEKL